MVEELTFKALGLMTPLCNNLAKLQILKPTPIQVRIIPALLSSNAHILVSAGNGKGKTLGSILPILHRLKQANILAGDGLTPRSSPKTIILTSSQDRAQYISNFLKALNPSLGLRFGSVLTDNAPGKLAEKMRGSLDVLISVKSAMENYTDWKPVQHILIDHIDTCMGTHWEKEVAEMLKHSPTSQLTMTTNHIYSTLPNTIQGLTLVEEARPSLGAVQHHFICLDPANEMTQFLDLLREKRQLITQGKCLVICRSIQQVQRVQLLLREHLFTALAYHGDLSSRTKERTLWKFSKGFNKVLVLTEVGLWTSGIPKSKLVISLGFPSSSKQYEHRASFVKDSTGTIITLHYSQDLDRIRAYQNSRVVATSEDAGEAPVLSAQ